MPSQTTIMTLRLPADLVRKLDPVSKRERRSRTQQILLYIEEGLARARSLPDPMDI